MAIIRFDWTLAKNGIRKTEEARMVVACEVVEAAAKYLCPEDKGKLVGAFSYEVESNQNEIIGRIKNSSSYAAAIEFGTKPHIIEPRDKKALSFLIGRKRIVAKKVHHPGFAGIPFLRGALIGKKREVMKILHLQ